MASSASTHSVRSVINRLWGTSRLGGTVRAAIVAAASIVQIGEAQSSPSDLTDILLSTVVMVSPANGTSYGSGTFITPYGHILTNYHVIDLDDGSPAEHAFIRVSQSFKTEPVFRYVAQLVAADRDLDIAVLRVVADSNFAPISSVQRFAYLPIGARVGLRPGVRISIWGYPGIAGRTITSTEGTIGGFVGEDLRSAGDRWIKTDAQVAPGNSGGAAITSDGVLIGIPTIITGRALAEDIAVTQNWLRPADMFLELVGNLPGAEIISVERVGGLVPQVAGPIGQPTPSDGVGGELDLDKTVTTSAELIARVRHGGLISLGEGTFQVSEPLNITSSTRIVGKGSDLTFIVSSAEGYAIRFSEGDIFRLEGVTVQHVDRLVADVLDIRGGQTVEVFDVRLVGAVNDSVLNRGGAGLAVRGSSRVVVAHSTFNQNESAGLSIHDDARVQVQSSVFGRNQGFGISMSGGSLTAAHLELLANAEGGAHIFGTASANLIESRIDSEAGIGLLLEDQASLTANGLDIQAAERRRSITVADSSHADLTGGTLAGAIEVRDSARLSANSTTVLRGPVAMLGSSVSQFSDVELTTYIDLEGSASLDARRVRITGVTGSNAINASDESNVNLVQSELRRNQYCGVFAEDYASIRIESTNFVENGGTSLYWTPTTAICAWGNSSFVVRDSYFTHNDSFAVMLNHEGRFEMSGSEVLFRRSPDGYHGAFLLYIVGLLSVSDNRIFGTPVMRYPLANYDETDRMRDLWHRLLTESNIVIGGSE